ncbi:MAG: choice-of-anchor D domain-containing protein [Planctomycetes bacterium]|nr:choice-of-anchor D domain-containing protein [Planctomycetota bacterium]
MKRSSILTIMFVFAVSFMVLGCSSESKTLKLTPSKLDFGTVNIGDTFTIDVVLKNKYGKDILISNITISGSNNYAITAGGTLPINLYNNAEHTLSIMLTPITAGPIIGLLSIIHDASTKVKEADLVGVGLAVPRIMLSDTAFDFAKKLINRTHNHDLEIENTGTADLNISNLSFVGAGATVYSISAGGPTPINISPGTTKTLTIAFEPLVVGNFAANLEIYHNAVNEASPMVYSVTGEAIDLDPQITLSQTSPWDFGTVATTKPSTQICEIENTGIDPLTVTSATLTTGTEFSVDSLKDSNGNVISFPQVIAVGAKIMLAIKFAPTANTPYNDTLTFVHDGTNEVTPWDISLTGEGRAEISKTFTYTGSAQQWTVPAGVTSIVVECFGAEGKGTGPGIGGKGGMAKATVPVTPSSTVYVYVGGKSLSATGGWNGGGTAHVTIGGGGGGASDIRIGGNTFADRKVVSGGGGGAGAKVGYTPIGGVGGGLIGGNGNGSAQGGTQTAGGAAGGGNGATAGVLGIGGNGRSNVGSSSGGGGGLYGGGGSGATYGGGGGGSSYYDAAGNTDKSTQSGVRSGNGEVSFKY